MKEENRKEREKIKDSSKMGGYRELSIKRICKYCGKEFIATQSKQIYCSNPHKENCFICGKIIYKPTKALLAGKCTCSKECSKEKTKRTNLEKYGVEYPLQSKEIQEKTTASLKEHFKDEDFKKEFKEKVKKTMLERYGVENSLQKNSLIRKKFEEENIAKYGIPNIGGIPSSLEKIKNTNLKRYGVDWTGKLERIKNSNRQRLLNPEVQEKMIRGTLKKYGVQNIMQVSLHEFIKPQYKELKNIDDFVNLKNYIKTLDKKPTITELSKYFNISSRAIRNNIKKEDLIEYIDGFYNYSFIEMLFVDFFKENNIYYEPHNRKIISPKELDFFLPEFNLAIEVSPTWTHKFEENQEFIGLSEKEYHYNKFLECYQKGIELITVFDWLNLDNIFSFIKDKIKENDKIIYARNCSIKKSNYSSKEKDFLNKNHIFGSVNNKKGSYVFNLIHEDEVVGVALFFPTKDEQQIELKRLAFKNNIKVIGGVSKLIENALKENNITGIMAFSDNSLGTGSVYKKIGFELKEENKGSLIWANPKENKYVKDLSLVEQETDRILKNFPNHQSVSQGENLPSNQEIIKSNGFYPIYDCGYRKWEYKKK